MHETLARRISENALGSDIDCYALHGHDSLTAPRRLLQLHLTRIKSYDPLIHEDAPSSEQRRG